MTIFSLFILIPAAVYIIYKLRKMSKEFELPNNYPKNIHLKRPLCYIDLETTGLDVKKDRIISIAIIKCYPPQSDLPPRVDIYKTYVNPGIPIPNEATIINKITDKIVSDYHLLEVYAPTILMYLKDSDIAGFNHIQFDIPLLQNDLERVGYKLDIKDKYLIDASKIFRKQHPRNLQQAYNVYCGLVLQDVHDAEVDARAVVKILDGQIMMDKSLGKPTVEDLAYYQICKRK